MNSILKNFLEFCFPHICIICRNPSNCDIDLCSSCENDLPFILNSCNYCGIPLDTDIKICGKCLKIKSPFDNTYSIFHYKKPIIQMITQLKFNQNLLMSKILGTLLAKHISFPQKPELIIPVPLHKKRLKERGFNQALEIARPLSKQLNIPIDILSCKRIRNTKAQTSIPAKLRKKNVKNAFKIIKPIKAKHVAIIDDVVTTGSTVIELSKVLRKYGVEKIDIICLARTS